MHKARSALQMIEQVQPGEVGHGGQSTARRRNATESGAWRRDSKRARHRVLCESRVRWPLAAGRRSDPAVHAPRGRLSTAEATSADPGQDLDVRQRPRLPGARSVRDLCARWRQQPRRAPPWAWSRRCASGARATLRVHRAGVPEAGLREAAGPCARSPSLSDGGSPGPCLSSTPDPWTLTARR